jgi:Protein of unknown function with HXXEE motif
MNSLGSKQEPGRHARFISVLALLAPVVFVIHVIEEAPAFVPWFNSIVEPDISQPLFLMVNGVGFLITVALSAALAATRSSAAAVADLAWLGSVFFANALFHLTATVVHDRYSPGAITAACLYLPYFALFFAAAVKRLRISLGAALLATVLGALPMAAHGYLIVFRGSRLF